MGWIGRSSTRGDRPFRISGSSVRHATEWLESRVLLSAAPDLPNPPAGAPALWMSLASGPASESPQPEDSGPNGFFRPDLTPIRPIGWSDAIVISNRTGTTSDSATLTADDTVYVDVAVGNIGTAGSPQFQIALYLDGNALPLTLVSPSLAVGQISTRLDIDLGRLSAGNHRFEVFADWNSAVIESDEVNNLLGKTFTVTGGGSFDLLEHQPPDWPGSIIVSKSAGTRVNDPVILPTDSVYIDFALRNGGTTQTGPFTLEVLLDGAAIGTDTVTGMAPFQPGGNYRFYNDVARNNLAAGQHTVTVRLDTGNTVPETNENNNTFSKVFTVGEPVVNGSIAGVVWEDTNGNGQKEAAEPPLAGWTVYLDDNSNGRRDAGERTQTTGAAGTYLFADVAPGTHIVGQELPDAGWEQTYPAAAGGITASAVAAQVARLTTTGSTDVLAWPYGDGLNTPYTNASGPLIRINQMRADARFSGIDGRGFASVIIDSGIDRDHPFFGPDNNGNGVADRIVYQWDFANNDADASDTAGNHGHGSNVASIVASQDSLYKGMAPGSDIIALKVFPDAGGGANDLWIEAALRWCVENAATYNIASVNLSLGFGNFTTAQVYPYSDEFAALVAMNVIPVAAAGNSFYTFNSVQGIGSVASDANVLAVGAVYDEDVGRTDWLNGQGGPDATDFTTAPDRVASFSQRHALLSDIFAPGPMSTGANYNGGTITHGGTSQASPHVAGVATLMQQLAVQRLGRRLTFAEYRDLLRSTGVNVVDGDDENDNVTNTGLTFKRLDVFALANAVWDLGGPPPAGSHRVVVASDQNVVNINFGNRRRQAGPEVRVTGGGGNVADGQAAPVNFGTVSQGQPGPSITFTVLNDGGQALTTSALTVPTGYTITEGLSATIAAGASDSFTVRLDSATAGTRTGTISFANNDADENPFDFPVTGVVQPGGGTGSIAGTVFNDANGNGNRDAGEAGLPGWTVFIDRNGNGSPDVASTGGTQVVNSTNVPRTISDNTTITSNLVSTVAGTVADIDVKLRITHTFDGDLRVVLISPEGTRVVLFDDIGGGGDNFTDTILDDEATTFIDSGSPPYNGRYRPFQLLSGVDGETAGGTWRLEVSDTADEDTGTLQSWSITFTTADTPGEPTAVTDAAGAYSFAGLALAAHDVRQMSQAGWTQTTPAGGVHAVTLTAAVPNVTGRNFGNRQPPPPGPDLVPFQPAGWSDRIVLSIVAGTTVDAARILSTDAIYFDWSVRNQGDANVPGRFDTRLLIDGVVAATWFTDGSQNIGWGANNIGVHTILPDFRVNPLEPGVHTVRVETDFLSAVVESDETNNAYQRQFTVVAPGVVGRHVFYNGSALDGGDAGASPADDGAIAADKSALLPGAAATAASVTGYVRGINGVMVDILGLPAAAAPTAADFVLAAAAIPGAWSAGPAPSAVAVRRGAGVNGSDRVTLVFADNAVRNGWLRVTVLSNVRTGLAAPDVFYLGNLVGDTGGAGIPAVNATDLALTRANVGNTSTAALRRFDYDHDNRVDARDVMTARNNQRHTLPLFAAPATVGDGAIAPAPRTGLRPTRRGVLDAPEPGLLA